MADSTANAGTSNEGGQNQAAAGSDKAFTQEEVNALLAKQKREMNAKYENYDEYKAAYDKSQEEAEARKSELERERDRAAAAEAELDALKAKADQAAWVAAVSKETGVPPEALHGATEEEVRACGEALKSYFTKPGAPVVPTGKPSSGDSSAGDPLRDLLRS